MSFMQAQLTEKMQWVAVETRWAGITYLPNDEVGLTEEDVAAWEESGTIPACLRGYIGSTDRNRVNQIELETGWGVRSSAPGYMDCTDWTVYSTLEEAEEAYEEERAENGEDEEEDDEDGEEEERSE